MFALGEGVERWLTDNRTPLFGWACVVLSVCCLVAGVRVLVRGRGTADFGEEVKGWGARRLAWGYLVCAVLLAFFGVVVLTRFSG